MNLRRSYRLRGVVQGVGMRPTIYRLATQLGLAGFVFNDGQGVIIEAEGPVEKLDDLLVRLQSELSPAARIDEIHVEETLPIAGTGFRILESPREGIRFTRISRDLATCDDCLRELHDPTDRRYRYPFINCTNCGPRLTIIRDVPYDRPRTTMAGFAMCPDCLREYHDPQDRRFHAQPNACPVCGPKLFLLKADGTTLDSDDTLETVAQALRQGEVVAVKGLGGVHLACNAADSQAVTSLRSRKFREEKPFALMVSDLNHARQLAFINDQEAELLTSVARPIVILDRKPNDVIDDGISPGLGTLGLMLPYTPLHTLLLESCGLHLVMTSGNLSEEPIAFRDDEIVPRLKGIADLFLLHDRPIHLRADDSVVRVVNGQCITLRRSRGYVPDPISLPKPLHRPILTCGAELKSTFCLGRDKQLILSHHIGDLENLAALEAFETGLEHFQRLFYTKPEAIACDLHPDYLSSQYARNTGLPVLEVQHHYAHTLACLAETGDFSPVLSWTLDGVGLGTDGTLWGGECLLVDKLDWRPMARLRPIPLPGGEKAIREPWRLAVAALWSSDSEEAKSLAMKLFPGRPVATIVSMLEKGLNCPLSTGAGRLFDAVAALAGVREEIVYEGQAAILLEAMTQRHYPEIVISRNDPPSYSMTIGKGEIIEMDWRAMMGQVVQDRLEDLPPGEIGARFHATLVNTLLEVTRALSNSTGLTRIALTGGVFQNRLLLGNLWRGLEKAGFTVLVPSQIPLNDGGIALGQAVALWLAQK